MIPDSLSLFIEQNPTTFWSIVVGSVASLVGIVIGSLTTLISGYFANRAHDKRLQKQFVHERSIRNRERDLALRKDVYLEATEAISAGMSAIMRFSDLSIPPGKVGENYAARSTAIAKVHVVANMEVTTAVFNLVGTLASAMFRLLAKRQPVESMQSQINVLVQQNESVGNDIDRDLELMRQLALDGPTNNPRWELLSKRVDAQLEQRKELHQEMDELRLELNKKHRELLIECTKESKKCGRALVPALAGIRHELDLPFDADEFSRLMDDNWTQLDAALADLLTALKFGIDDKNDSESPDKS